MVSLTAVLVRAGREPPAMAQRVTLGGDAREVTAQVEEIVCVELEKQSRDLQA